MLDFYKKSCYYTNISHKEENMALTVNLTKLATPYKVTPVLAVAQPTRDNKGRFATIVKAAPAATKGNFRATAPYRINGEGDVYPFKGGSVLANVWSPKLKEAMLKAGLVA